MSIKIIPEKLAVIEKHKTRKRIKSTTYAGKDLISRASHLTSLLEVANKQLHQINIPYLKDCKIVFYSPEKIILSSNKEILKSKVKELHSQFIKLLNQHTFFSKLVKIEIQIDYKLKSVKKKTIEKVSQNTKDHLNNLKQIFPIGDK